MSDVADDRIIVTNLEQDLQSVDKQNDRYTDARETHLSLLHAAIEARRPALLTGDAESVAVVTQLITLHDRLLGSNEKAKTSRAVLKLKLKEAQTADLTNEKIVAMFQRIATGTAPAVQVAESGAEDVDVVTAQVVSTLTAEGVIIPEHELRESADDLS